MVSANQQEQSKNIAAKVHPAKNGKLEKNRELRSRCQGKTNIEGA